MVKETLNQTISECVTVSFCSLMKNSEAEGTPLCCWTMNQAFPETQNALGHLWLMCFPLLSQADLEWHTRVPPCSTFWFSLGTKTKRLAWENEGVKFGHKLQSSGWKSCVTSLCWPLTSFGTFVIRNLCLATSFAQVLCKPMQKAIHGFNTKPLCVSPLH